MIEGVLWQKVRVMGGGKKRPSLREGLEPSVVFISDFGAVLLLGLLGLIALLIVSHTQAFAVTFGLLIAAYAVAFGFPDLIGFGEVHRAGEFTRSAFRLKILRQ